MNILIIAPMYYPLVNKLSYGGVEKSVTMMAKELSKSHSVSLLVSNDSDIKLENIEIIKLPQNSYSVSKFPEFSKEILNAVVYNSARFNVIINHNMMLDLLSWLTTFSKSSNKIVLNYYHHLANIAPKEIFSMINSGAIDVDSLVGVSKAVVDSFNKELEEINSEKRMTKFHYLQVYEECGISDPTHYYLYAGRVDKIKNPLEVVEEFKLFYDCYSDDSCQLYLVGDYATYDEDYVNQVKSIVDSCNIIRKAPANDYVKLMTAMILSKAVVNPCKVESFGNVTYEAFCRGCLVFVPKINEPNGSNELIDIIRDNSNLGDKVNDLKVPVYSVDYLNSICEEWTKDNKLKIKNAMKKFFTSERFINKFNELIKR